MPALSIEDDSRLDGPTAESPIPQDKINYNFIYRLSVVVSLGGLLFGFDLSIISGTIASFSEHFNLQEGGIGLSVGCINIGAAIGALLAGRLADSFGRKKTLLFCALLFALTGVGTGWAGNFTAFIVFRMLSGMAVGIAALVCPMYIAEISPAAGRGRLVALYQLAITVGILLAYLSNYFLLHSGENNWRWMFSSQSAPAILFFAGLFFVTESPRWLVRKNRTKQAENILEKIGGSDYARRELNHIENSFRITNQSGHGLGLKLVGYIIFLGIMVAFFSQAVGQNSLFSYAPEIFKEAGTAQNSAFFQSVILGVINLVFTFFAIGTVDRYGRKRLLLIGATLLFIDSVALALCFTFQAPATWILIFILSFIAIYAATLGPVTWVLLSEIFPNRIRGKAMGAATLSLWISNFLTTASFPVMKAHLGMNYVFGIHSLICLAYVVFIIKKLPETKQKSLEEIESFFNKNS
jgi:SP family arabinose:H+ symporter-like MFS transporter